MISTTGTEVGPQFLLTEEELREELGQPLEHPLRVFELDGLGLSFEDLKRQVAPSFAELPWDEYDARRDRVELLAACFPEHERKLRAFLPGYFVGARDLDDVRGFVDALGDADRARFDRIRPFRRRALASFTLTRGAVGAWDLERAAEAPFTQAADHAQDYRQLERRFASSPPEVTEAPEYVAVLGRLATIVDELRGGTITSMRITCHQMSLVARPSRAVTNSPEGIHQDGSDYIVSALVIERRNVVGGDSVVYGPDKRTEYLRRTLAEGEGILQADAGSPLWHQATPVTPADGSGPGAAVRSILGYDIQLT